MKTAISVPDKTFERASRLASALGMSRSEFFSRAAEYYMDELDAQSLTGQIDGVLERVGQSQDESAAEAMAVGRQVLSAADDDW